MKFIQNYRLEVAHPFLEGVNFHFGGLNWLGGALQKKEQKMSPKLSYIKFFQETPSEHPNPRTWRPKSRDIPTIPLLKQQTKAPCIKFLSGRTSGIPKAGVRDIPISASLMSQEYPARKLILTLFYTTR